MGQKTHPHGFRLGFNKQWSSRWFSKGTDYSRFIHQDLEMKDIIKKRCFAIIGDQRLKVFFLPLDRIVNLDSVDLLGKPVKYGSCQPLPSVAGFNAVTVLPFILLVLDIV